MPNVVLLQPDKIIRDVAALLFESTGFNVRAFADFPSASGVAWGEVDAVVAEVDLTTSGLDVLSRIRRSNGELPVIAVSERLSLENRVDLDRLAIQAAFEKPVTFDLLLGAVERLVGYSRADHKVRAA